MSKAWGYPYLFFIFLAQIDARPFAKLCMAELQIHRNIKNLTARHPYEFSLGLFNLVMQTAQYPSATLTMIVLHKIDINACCLNKGMLIKTFQKNPRSSSNTFGVKTNTPDNSLRVTVYDKAASAGQF